MDLYVWKRLYGWSSFAYETGVAMLGLGVLGLLAPPVHASLAHSVCRWTAVGAAVIGQVVSTQRSYFPMTVRRS